MQYTVSIKTLKKTMHLLCRKCNISFTKKNKSPKEKQAIEQRRKSTCLEKFGVDCAFNTEKSRNELKKVDWDKRNKKSKSTKERLYGDSNFNNREKSKSTMNEKYGMHSSKVEDVKNKQKETNNKRYGGNSPQCSKDIHKKSEQTKERLYGDKNFNNHQQYIKTCQENFGVDNAMKVPENVQKALAAKHFDVLRKRGLVYNDIYFDSSWELAYYIWLTDNKKSFIYQPQMPLLYKDDEGTDRQYFPDFLVEGQFVEIKGNQFFNEKDEPFDLYKKKYWWSKYNALIKYNVYIMREAEAFTYVKYVNEKYGKNFLKSHKL